MLMMFDIKNKISGNTRIGFFGPGQSVEQVMYIYGIEKENAIITVNNKPVSEKHILSIDELLRFEIIPTGGSAKNTLLGIVALATGGLFAGALGLAQGTWAYTAVATISASALSKQFVSGPQINTPTSYSQDPRNNIIQSQQNQYKMNQVVPVVLGDRIYAPPKAALDFSEISGNDYYYNILLCPGYGRLDISEIKIGETSIDDYDEVSYSIVENKDENTRFNYFNKDVYEESIGAELTDSDWTTRTSQAETDQISLDLLFPEGLVTFNENNDKNPRAIEIYLEYKKTADSTWIPFQNSINLQLSEGVEKIDALVTEFKGDLIQFIPHPTNADEGYIIFSRDKFLNYIPFLDGDVISISGTSSNNGSATLLGAREYLSDYASYGIYVSKTGFTSEVQTGVVTLTKTVSQTPFIRITDTNTSAVRKNIKFTTPENEQYDIRIKRKTAASESSLIKDRCDWAILRSINSDINKDLVPDGLSYLEIRIKATDQLQGAVDTVACRCKSYLPVYDSTSETWTTEISRNPAWAAIHLLKGSMNDEPADDEIIDLEAFETWADWCDTNEYYFDGILDSERSLIEVLHDIASAARASIFIQEGKWTVVQDIAQSIPKYLITTRNILKDSFSFSKSFKKKVQCLKIRFLNDDNKEDEYPVCIDGYGIPGTPGYNSGDIYPDVIEELTYFGVKEPDQIYKLGRKLLNNNILQPFIYSWEMDIEHYNINKGDRVLFSHDLMRFDLSRGRIKSVTENGSSEAISILVDEACEMVAGQTYVIHYMNGDTTIKENVSINTNPDNLYSIVFSSPISSNKPQVGNYFVFGKTEMNSFQITSIEPSGSDKGAKITAVDYKSGVYDLGTTPTYESNITVQDKVLRQVPPVPEIESLVSDESVLQKLGDGTLVSRILINIKQDSGNGIQPEYYQAQYKASGKTTWNTEPAVAADSKDIYISGVDDAETYDIRVRSIYKNNASGWCSSVSHTVVGKTTPPGNVSNFAVSVEGVNFNFSFDKLSALDVSEYEIREKNTDWDDSTVFLITDSNKATVKNSVEGAGTRTFLIKAKDTTGLYSETPAEASVNIPLPSNVTNFNISIAGEHLVMEWDLVPEKYVEYYEIREKNTNWEDSDPFAKVNSNKILIKNNIEGTGNRAFLIKAKDIKGNYSEIATEDTIQIFSPATPILKPSVEKNRVYIDWQDCKTSFPIKTYKLRKEGTDWETAQVVNDFIGAITIYPTSESESKEYTYRCMAIDTAGNESFVGTVSIPVGDSFDFQLYTTNEQADFSESSLSNAIIKSNGNVLLPVNTTETWNQHFINNSWTTINDQINAGYPLFAQPSAASGYLEFSFDMGDSVINGQIESIVDSEMIGNPSIDVKTFVSNDDTNWTEFSSSKVYVEEEFRYIKIRLTATSNVDTDLLIISKITTRVKLESKEESGSSTISTYNQSVSLSESFNQIESITASVSDSTEPVLIACADYDSANPTSFKVRIWDISGTAMGEAGYTGPSSVKIDWRVKGK